MSTNNFDEKLKEIEIETQGMGDGRSAPILIAMLRRCREQRNQLIVEYAVAENVDGDFTFAEQEEEIDTTKQEHDAELLKLAWE